MSLPGDPNNAAVTYALTDQGGGNFRLRRRAVNGVQFRITDWINADIGVLRHVGTAAAEAEGLTLDDQVV